MAPPAKLPQHLVVLEEQARRAADIQLRIADWITAFAGSMNFVYLHVVLFTVWMLFIESKPRTPHMKRPCQAFAGCRVVDHLMSVFRGCFCARFTCPAGLPVPAGWVRTAAAGRAG
jgi:hypothetical protein